MSDLTYDEQLEHMVDRGDSREDIKEFMRAHNDYIFDFDNMPTPGDHRWVDRGEVLSCEGAGHPNHRHFKRR